MNIPRQSERSNRGDNSRPSNTGDLRSRGYELHRRSSVAAPPPPIEAADGTAEAVGPTSVVVAAVVDEASSSMAAVDVDAVVVVDIVVAGNVDDPWEAEVGVEQPCLVVASSSSLERERRKP